MTADSISYTLTVEPWMAFVFAGLWTVGLIVKARLAYWQGRYVQAQEMDR